MPFTVEDFHDLTALLEQRPNWRSELRRLLLTDEVLRLPALVQQLVEAQQRAEARLAGVEGRLGRLETRVGSLQGHDLERQFRERAHAYLGRWMRRVHILTSDELAKLVEDAVDGGRLSDSERADLFAADVIARGRRLEDGAEVYAVGEVSVGVGPQDVRRAAQRAGIMSKLQVALPFVGGERVTPAARSLAAKLRVWQVVDGHVTGP